MAEIMMRKTIDFGKYDFFGSGKKVNPCDVRIEIRKCGGNETFRYVNGKKEFTGEKTPEYVELSIVGNVWNRSHTDIKYGGQCLDEMAKIIKDPKFQKIYEIWKKWHLNGNRSGTPEQEKKIKEWIDAGNEYDYHEICKMLSDCDMYVVEYTGKSVGRMYDHEPYRYGSGWLVEDLPSEVIDTLNKI